MYSIVVSSATSVLEYALLQRIQDMYQTQRGIIGFDYIFYECWDIWGSIFEERYPYQVPNLKTDLLKEDFDAISNSLICNEPFIIEMVVTLEQLLMKYDFSVYSPSEGLLFNKWTKEVW